MKVSGFRAYMLGSGLGCGFLRGPDLNPSP